MLTTDISESQGSHCPIQTMQKELHNGGAVLTKAWSDLFGIIMKCQMELSVKENTLEIADKQVEMRMKQLEKMKPLLQTGNEELSKLQDEIQISNRKLFESQQKLSLKERMFEIVESDLQVKTNLLEMTNKELTGKQKELIKHKKDIESFESELTVKQELIEMKENLLQKVQGQLLKENADLKEQIDFERKSFELERQTLGMGNNQKKRRKLNTVERKPMPLAVDEDVHSSDTEHDNSPSLEDSTGDRPMCVIKDTYFTEHAQILPSQTRRSTDALQTNQIATTSLEGKSLMRTTDTVNFDNQSNGISSSAIFPISLSKGKVKGETETVHVMLNKSFEDMNSPYDEDKLRSVPMAVPISKPIFNTDSKSVGCGPVVRETEHKCKLCGKFFPNVRGLCLHERSHKGGRHLKSVKGSLEWKCQICGVVYRQRANLKSHMMTHTGERPFACARCGKAFRRKDLLKEHINIHTGERSHSCEVCGKCFTQRGTMLAHKRNVHDQY